MTKRERLTRILLIAVLVTPVVNWVFLFCHEAFGKCEYCGGRVLCNPGCADPSW